jgi:hypothetical protein
MGVVFRARDSKLGRDVPLMILPAAFATDPDRLMRFAREAKTPAATSVDDRRETTLRLLL